MNSGMTSTIHIMYIIKLLASEASSDLRCLWCIKSVFFSKMANIIPVPKKVTSVAAGDFRPISIQLMVLLKQIEDLSKNSGMFSKTQLGFSRRVSSITLLHQVNRHIRNNLNVKKLSIMVVLDFQKHLSLLITKIFFIGFDANSLGLLN